MAGNRDYSLDALKMILIILVIYAHIPLLNGLIPIGANVECDALTWHSVKGIYAFHMPLFVFLSGYLTKRKLLAVQFGKSQKLIKLFVVFHIVDLVLKWIVAGVRHSLHGIVCPSFALWYLLCLFYWRILISALPENINKKYAVSYSVLLSLLVGFIPIQGEFGFQRFFSFMPYIFLGHYYGRSVLKTVDNKVVLPPPRTYLLSGLIVIVLFVAILISSFNPRWLVVIISPYPDFKGLFFRLMFLCGSSILCYLILIVCKFKRDWSRNILAKVGSETLFFIYYIPMYFMLLLPFGLR